MNISDSEYFSSARIKKTNENEEIFNKIKDKQIIKILNYGISSKNSKEFIEIKRAILFEVASKIGKPTKVIFIILFLF